MKIYSKKTSEDLYQEENITELNLTLKSFSNKPYDNNTILINKDHNNNI